MMLKNFAPGVYIPGNTLLHRLQARTKILLLVWFVLWVFISNQRRGHYLPYVVVIGCACLSLVLAGISFKQIWLRVWPLVLILLLGAIPTLLTTANIEKSKVLVSLGPLPTSYGLVRQVLLAGLILVIVLFLTSFLPHLKQRRAIKLARAFLILAMLAGLITLWLLAGSADSAQLALGPLVITDYGIWLLVTVFVILLVFYTISLILTSTTSPIALIEGLSMLLSPLRRFKLPVDDFALMSLLALRFVPTLLEELEMLLKAQTARGADLSQGSPGERLRSLTSLFVPLVQGIFRRASELATALEARGYEVEGSQTRLYESFFARVDYLVIGSVIIMSLLSFLL